jgi:hypothetical protein
MGALEPVGQAFVDRLRLPDVAAQVVQAHQGAGMPLTVTVGLYQLFGQPHRRVEIAPGFSVGQLLADVDRGQLPTLRALLRQPRVEGLAVVEAQLGQQGSGRLARSGLGREVARDTRGQPQRFFADQELDAVDLPEARQLLPQRTTRVMGIGPQQGGCACPRDRRLQHHERQQTRRAALERTDRAGDQQRGVVEQAQAHIGRPGVAPGWG